MASTQQLELPLGAGGERPTLTNPGVFVVDAGGKIAFAHADTAYAWMLDRHGIKQAV